MTTCGSLMGTVGDPEALRGVPKKRSREMDEDVKRGVLRKIPYGMYVMTALADGAPVASTLTWISQCSFHPPLVMIGVQSNSRMHEAVEKSGSLAVHFLSEGQQETARRFFRPPAGEDGKLHG